MLIFFGSNSHTGGEFLNSLYKNLLFWAIIIIVMVLLFQLFNKPRQTASEKNYSDFISAVENNQVQEVEATGRNIVWKDTEGKRYKTYAPEDPEMIKLLREKHVVINAKKEEETSILAEHPHLLVSDDSSGRGLDLLHAAGAGGRRKGPLLWKEQGQNPDQRASSGHL